MCTWKEVCSFARKSALFQFIVTMEEQSWKNDSTALPLNKHEKWKHGYSSNKIKQSGILKAVQNPVEFKGCAKPLKWGGGVICKELIFKLLKQTQVCCKVIWLFWKLLPDIVKLFCSAGQKMSQNLSLKGFAQFYQGFGNSEVSKFSTNPVDKPMLFSWQQ